MAVSQVRSESVLAIPAFRRLFTAQVVALVGTGLLTVALGLLAYDIAGSSAGAVLGTALAVKMVAYVGVAPVMSVLTGRLPRTTVLVSADVVRLAIAVLLPFVTQVWQVYVLVFVLQAASATFTPTFQAVVPAVISRDDQYTRALSLSRLAYDLESLLSPMLAAALLTVVSYHLLFVGTALGFALSAVLVVGTRLPDREPRSDRDGSRSFGDRLVAGVRRFGSRPSLRGLLALNLVVAAGTALVIVNSVVYVRDVVGGSASALAVALGVFGGGSMMVAFAVPRILTVVDDRRLMLAGGVVVSLGTTGAVALAALRPSGAAGWASLAVAWAVLGAGTSMISTPSARVITRDSDDGDRDELFTAQFSLSHACFLLTYPVAGWVGAEVSQVVAASVIAALATLAALGACRLWTPASTVGAPPTE
ncbi:MULTISPECIES: MFS transporter [Nocardiaceae]|uniref:MFS transporter n=1 Tax=Nocardiaceae TaxID=85025 RepID=UPI001B5645B5|nr:MULTISPECIES: MFS transporter [Rhodococcus]MBP1117908.1 MFS family permease [Rhodococcus sp. PvP016]